MPVKDVVAQYQHPRIIRQKIFTDQKCLRQSVGDRLHGILLEFPTASHRPVIQQSAAYPPASRSPESRECPPAAAPQRVVDHRLVIHRQQLLRNGLRHRMQPRPRTTRKNNPLHRAPPSPRSSAHPLLIRAAAHTLHPRRIARYHRTVLPQPVSKALLASSPAHPRSSARRSHIAGRALACPSHTSPAAP